MTNLGRILVVDDELELKNVLVEALAAQGYEAAGFATADEALMRLRLDPFDILLTDLMMPGMDGITLLRESLQIDPDLICIMMTGQGTIQTAVDAMKVGAFDYVLKPFRLQTMMPVLTRAMNSRHLRLENVQLREAIAIYELCQTIAFTLDPPTILSKLADAALLQSEADEVSVLLPAKDADEFYVAAVRGEKRERLLGERVPFGESISSWVARELEPLILNGEIDDERFVALWPRPEIRSSVSIPMLVSKKLIGVLNLNMVNRPRRFSLGQMKALSILAGTAAAALESSMLYTQVIEAEKNYRSIFENAPDGIFRATPDGVRFISVNPTMARMFGYESPKEMVEAVADVTVQLGLDPAQRDEALAVLREQGQIENFEASVRREDSSEISICANARAIQNAEGEFIYFDGIVQDVTVRKRAEEALRESEARYRDLVENSHEIICTHDLNGSILSLNRAAFDVFGYHPDEFVNKRTIQEFLVPEVRDQFDRYMKRIVEQGSSSGLMLVQTKTGERKVLEYYNSLRTEGVEKPIVRAIARDVTERLQAEKALRESEERYKGLSDSAFDGIVIHRHGKIVSLNRAYAEMFGYTAEELVGEDILKLTPDERKDSVNALISKQQPHYESVGLKKDGTVINIEVSGQACMYEGQAARLAAVRDITERKRAEIALRESEERYRDLVENAHDIIYSHDLRGNYTSVNRAGEEITGYTHDECLALKITDTVAPEYIGKIRGMIGQKLAGKSATAYEIEIVAKDGHRIAVEVNTKLIYEDGVPVGVHGIARDITDRKRAQAELTRLAAAVEQTADSIIITDTEGNIEYVNPAFERITGYTKEEVAGLNPRLLKSGQTSPALYRELWQTIAQGEIWTGQFVNRKKDGTLFNERATISAVRDETGKIAHYLAVKQDTTHEMELQEQLRQSQKMEAVGRLAGGVAHDFNNLLTAINGYSSLALQRVDENSSIKPYLEEVKKAGDRAANLTRQLLAFGRKQILQPLAIDLNSVVSDMNKMLRRLIGEDIEFGAKLAPDLKKIQADPGQIEQVLVNLVVNARDAMPQGGKLTIETANMRFDREYVSKHVEAQPGDFVMLAVSDTGVGMDEDTRARIFEPFFTTKEKGKGTGLGLSTVYGIVKQSGGHIFVYSEPNRGTSFKVYLPQLETEVVADAKQTPEDEVQRGSETILLVEDEEVVRGLTTSILEDAGYKVISAGGGHEAVELCANRAEPIDLLLTDVVMPQASGKEVADRLTKLRPGLRVLFMSGYTDESIVHHGVLDANVEFIQKPFTPLALTRKVREVLERNGSS